MDYFIKVNLALALFYCFYQLVLKRSVYFGANRAFLLSGLGLAFIIPAFHLPLGSLSGIATDFSAFDALLQPASTPLESGPSPVLLDTVSIIAGEQARASLTLGDWAVIIYCAMSSLFLLRSEEHTSELQSLMRISYAVFCLKKKKYL